MNREAIEKRMNALAIGQTTTINGAVVTRWNTDCFELGTRGKATMDRKEALDCLSSIER